jgi:uroporphyrin-III C-methyltransferase/precorrin-2 dehydrogenase/sirohydrochlorin ferrochelatase
MAPDDSIVLQRNMFLDGRQTFLACVPLESSHTTGRAAMAATTAGIARAGGRTCSDGVVVPVRGRRGAARGRVALVGAGPGDPELLTLRAARLIGEADALVYDRLVAPQIVAMARAGARRFYVGKERDHHTLPQEAICALLVRLAEEGLHVVRLKGGDPFVFGRGGEELEALVTRGIDFEVVPGVTAANGVAAYAGIPLTHRDHAQACVFVTGHSRDGTMHLDWPALARPRQTLVVYMGLQGLPTLCRELVAHGLPATTPAAVIASGTTSAQEVVTGTLATLPILAQGLRPPTLIIVGEVVALQPAFAWHAPAARPERAFAGG